MISGCDERKDEFKDEPDVRIGWGDGLSRPSPCISPKKTFMSGPKYADEGNCKSWRIPKKLTSKNINVLRRKPSRVYTILYQLKDFGHENLYHATPQLGLPYNNEY